jgi:hypothetical protein
LAIAHDPATVQAGLHELLLAKGHPVPFAGQDEASGAERRPEDKPRGAALLHISNGTGVFRWELGWGISPAWLSTPRLAVLTGDQVL